MKILYDDAAFNASYGGVVTYFAEIMKNLPKGFSYDIAVRTVQTLLLQKPPFNLPKSEHTFWTFCPWLKIRGKSYLYRAARRMLPCMCPSCEWENRKVFIAKLKKGDFDVLHLTDPHWYTFEWEDIVGKKPIVMTVHDLIPDMFQKRMNELRKRRARALRLVDHVIAVSENTKRDVIKLYGTPAEKISVVGHGHSTVAGGGRPAVYPGLRYVLYVGGRRGYKNFDFFAQGIAGLMMEYPWLNLVCTGGRLSDLEMKPFKQAEVAERVHAKFIDEQDMPPLYANAELFVYPSKYEGFGIPILDAFAAGCPVLLARSSCFPEVGGDAALYFDLDDADDMKEKIKSVLDDPDVRRGLIDKGYRRVADFTWEKSAEKTAAIYQQTLGVQI